MKPGEKVLVLLPSDSNKLLMQWQGPYQIVKRLGKVDYQLEVKGKVKTYHANMLKKYVERCEPVVNCVMSVVDSEQIDDSDVECSQETDFLEVQSRETHVDVDVNPELSRDEKQKMKELLYRYSDVLSDVPGHTHVLEHEIRTTTDRPVRVSPRQIPFAMMNTVKDEVSKMLEFGVIEPSDSPYSSPIVLVVKKDHTYRFCVDFRALNRITVFDAEPMPDVDAMFAKLSGHKYFSRLDLSKGYWQVPLTHSARPLTAFQTLKSSITTSPVLKLPDLSKVFIVQTDSSDRGLGAVLLQEEGDFKLPVAYASRKLKTSEEHYSTIEKECLGIIWSVQKFHRYLYGKEFILETDHHPLMYLNKTKLVNSRLMRWALLLQPYRFRIIAIRGKDNVGADYLSRQT